MRAAQPAAWARAASDRLGKRSCGSEGGWKPMTAATRVGEPRRLEMARRACRARTVTVWLGGQLTGLIWGQRKGERERYVKAPLPGFGAELVDLLGPGVRGEEGVVEEFGEFAFADAWVCEAFSRDG